jgi:two-component system, OmpR family, KDP operon response regulator KdpE
VTDIVRSTPEKPARILVIDDEPQIRRALKSILQARHYDVRLAENGGEGLDAAIDVVPDLVVLDLSLPDMSGFTVAEELRAWYEGPILVLSVRDADVDKITALDQGADDYLTKPFSAGELLARVRALLRRSQGGAAPAKEIRAGELVIDVARRQVTVAGELVHLTRTEFDILALLARNADRVVTSRMLLEQVWGPEYETDTQALRVHVSHLRQKVEPPGGVPRHILTEPGVGFRFVGD